MGVCATLLLYMHEPYEMTLQMKHDKINKCPPSHSFSCWTLETCFVFQKDLWQIDHDAAWSLGFLQKMSTNLRGTAPHGRPGGGAPRNPAPGPQDLL